LIKWIAVRTHFAQKYKGGELENKEHGRTQGYDEVYALQPHFVGAYKRKSVDKLCHVGGKNSA
jgi:hypothetical protein